MHISSLLAVVLTLVASAAHAVITYSPPVRSSEGNNFYCWAQNVSSNTVDVEAEIRNGQGGGVGSNTMSIPPGQSRLIIGSQVAIFGGFCQFTFDADPYAVRGAYTREDAAGSDARLVLPARVLEDTGPARDTLLATPPITASDGNNFGCQLQNLSDADVQINSELRNSLGEVVDDSTVTVPPGRSQQGAVVTAADVFGGFCTVSFTAPPDQVRAFATLQPAGGGDTDLIVEALPGAPPPAPATPTPTLLPTAAPSITTTVGPPLPCCGDCDADGSVAINELITAVNNALGACGGAE